MDDITETRAERAHREYRRSMAIVYIFAAIFTALILVTLAVQVRALT